MTKVQRRKTDKELLEDFVRVLKTKHKCSSYKCDCKKLIKKHELETNK